MKKHCFLLALLIASVPIASAEKQDLEQMQKDFLDLKFGMFLHYNMATYKGAQWVRGYVSPADFNPGVETIDTDAWAEAAKSAGMTYIVLTVKHVSGFSLWDSEHTSYDVMHPDCPYQKDLVRQFVDSCTKYGLKVGLYYCWRNPGFDDGKNKGEFKVLPPECDPAKHSAEEQIEFQKKQIAELIEKFPECVYLWNDALDPRVMTAEDAAAFHRGLPRPILFSGNWWDWGKKGTRYGDIAVTEKKHFPEANSLAGETCWCLEQSWFWQKGFKPKPAANIVKQMETAHSRGANFLLNLGPDPKGNLEPASVEVLAEIGKLTKKK